MGPRQRLVNLESGIAAEPKAQTSEQVHNIHDAVDAEGWWQFAHRLAADTPTLDAAVGTSPAMLTQLRAVAQCLHSNHKLFKMHTGVSSPHMCTHRGD